MDETPDGMSPAEQEAFDRLLPAERRTGVLADDLAYAAREAMRRRRENTRFGAAVLGALHREVRSWRRVQDMTGVPWATARKWQQPPPEINSVDLQ